MARMYISGIRNRNAGFSLLELIVSIGAIALLSIVLSQVFFSTLRTNIKTELLKDIKQNGDIAQETLVRMVQNAQSVTSACDASGTTSGTITITNADGGSTTLGCVLDGTVTRVASQSGSYTDYVTSSNVTLGGTNCATSSLVFTCKGGAGIQRTVMISFSLAQRGAPVDQFEQSNSSFQTSVTTRGFTR